MTKGEKNCCLETTNSAGLALKDIARYTNINANLGCNRKNTSTLIISCTHEENKIPCHPKTIEANICWLRYMQTYFQYTGACCRQFL
ncbi:hypothetical protein L1987_77606 [Smallanthus sonchifolius]|uniref:Uncharacterized protein n=1 Tax=Smallanthus sonchifolius TaxID=185202 RepID=A0ACB8ZBB7_9ASTR|nr:hypothetical protein L1987_77606 [Smallanthus sonchifolius]